MSITVTSRRGKDKQTEIFFVLVKPKKMKKNVLIYSENRTQRSYHDRIIVTCTLCNNAECNLKHIILHSLHIQSLEHLWTHPVEVCNFLQDSQLAPEHTHFTPAHTITQPGRFGRERLVSKVGEAFLATDGALLEDPLGLH